MIPKQITIDGYKLTVQEFGTYYEMVPNNSRVADALRDVFVSNAIETADAYGGFEKMEYDKEYEPMNIDPEAIKAIEEELDKVLTEESKIENITFIKRNNGHDGKALEMKVTRHNLKEMTFGDHLAK